MLRAWFCLVPITPSLVWDPQPHSPKQDCHPVLQIRGVPLREVWWFAQHHS